MPLLRPIPPRRMPVAPLILAFLATGPAAWANSGAPALGFAFDFNWPWLVPAIALAEAAALRLFWKRGLWHAFWLLLAANMLSSLVGGGLLQATGPGVTLDNLLGRSVLAWCEAFALSVVAEYPVYFVLFLVPKPGRLLRSLGACAVIHAAFYVLAAPLYLYYGYYAPVGRYAVAHDTAYLHEANAWIYYVVPSRDAVRRCRLDGSGDDAVAPLEPALDPWYETIWLGRNSSGGAWDLGVVNEKPGNRPVLAGAVASPLWEPARRNPWSRPAGTADEKEEEEGAATATGRLASYEPMLCADLRAPGERTVGFRTASRWYLYAAQRDEEGRYRRSELVVHSPSWEWPMRNVSVLPGDRVVFALGDQICVLDYPHRRIAVVARGYRPLVVRDRPEPWQEEQE